MTEVEATPIEAADSPSFIPGEQNSDPNQEAQFVELAGMFLRGEENPPGNDQEVTDTAIENSVEANDTEDEEIVEAGDEDTGTKDWNEDESRSVVDYDELKDYVLRFRVGGEERDMTIDQIRSQLGQVQAASKSQQEVKVQQEELDQIRSQIEAERASLESQKEIGVQSRELAQIETQYQQYEKALEKARADKDVNQMTLIKDYLDQLKSQYSSRLEDIEHKQAEVAKERNARQARRLQELGYGNLLTDKQRSNALLDYAEKTIPDETWNIVNKDAALLVALEKARLWDSSQKKAGKLKTTKRTLKEGSGRTPSMTQKSTSVDDGFDAIAKSIIGI